MSSQVVHFYSDGFRIEADYLLPEGAKPGDRLPAIVMCQGFGGARHQILPDFAVHFVAAGYAVCAFDYRGFGGSEGRENRLMCTEHAQDIRAALTWLGLQPEVDPERLGLWGTSGGAANVIHTAGHDVRAKCTVAQVGYGDGYKMVMGHKSPEERKALLEAIASDRDQRVLTGKSGLMRVIDLISDADTQGYVLEVAKTDPSIITYLTLESAEATLEYKPIDVVARIAPRAVMLIVGEKDGVCLPDDYKDVFERASEPKRWVSFPIGHYEIYAAPWVEKSAQEALAWYKIHL